MWISAKALTELRNREYALGRAHQAEIDARPKANTIEVQRLVDETPIMVPGPSVVRPYRHGEFPVGRQCDHGDMACPEGTCDWSGRDGRDG